MAATGPRKYATWTLALGLLFPVLARPDQASDLRTILQRIATGLTDENPADALKPFDRSFSGYNKLSDYFNGLTASYQITNEVNVVDEQDSSDQTTATVDWTITLGDKTNPGVQDSRYRQIQVRMIREKKHWKIIEFSPIDLFDPQFHSRSGNPPQ